MTQSKKGRLEKAAWIILIVGLLIAIAITLLFMKNRIYSTELPIDNEVFGQYGEIIGGVFGTIVSLIGFFLLYETLNEQRKQSRIQNENQIFYHLIDKQQNRINNIETPEYEGYKIFEFLTKNISKCLIEECRLIAEELLCETPEKVSDSQFEKIFIAQNNEFDLTDFESHKRSLMYGLLDKNPNERWGFLEWYFGNIGISYLQKAFRDIGTEIFYKFDFKYRRQIYNKIFQNVIDEYGFFLDGYLKEQEYFVQIINKSTESKLYKDYLISQMTNYEYVVLFYYLLSGYSSKEFALFLIDTKIIDSVLKLNGRIIDLPSENEIKAEIEYIKLMY